MAEKSLERTVDLVSFMGQSNMAGRGESGDAVVCPVGHGYEFKAVQDPSDLYPVSEPFGLGEDNNIVNDYDIYGKSRKKGGLVSSLMEAYYTACRVPIVGVSCSRGGTDTDYWTSTAVLDEAASRLEIAKRYLIQSNHTIRHCYLVWCQGETDGDRLYQGLITTDLYINKTKKVFEHMKKKTGVEVCFVIQTGHYNWAYDPAETMADTAHDKAYVAIAMAQLKLPVQEKNIRLAGSFLDYRNCMKDLFHYHQSVYNSVGKNAGNIMARTEIIAE